MIHETYRDRRTLVTGHTGFKGGWMAAWLTRLGAQVTGYALPPEPPDTAIFTAARVAEGIDSRTGDVNDLPSLLRLFKETQPEIVFHLAAQALVRRSYHEPVKTFSTNVMGTVNVLEACRQTPSVRAVVVVTSDKCYENQEWDWSYRENDPLGGSDPYSASKGCAELVAQAYARSFFREETTPLLATARAGNVFGGGDESLDRLVPDMVRAIRTKTPVILRYPQAVRPWQHALEPLHGYLTLGERLYVGDRKATGPWNFGPDETASVTVETFARTFMRLWGNGAQPILLEPATLHEAGLLRLDSSRARRHLGWEGRLSFEEAIAWSVNWYRSPKKAVSTTERQLDAYEELLSR